MVNLTPREVINLFPDALERQYPAGQIVIYQGDRPNHIFYVKHGALKYYDIDESGTEKIMQIVGEHSFFSVISAFGSSSETGGFYSTLDDSDILLIEIDEFKHRLSSDSALYARFFEWFVSEVKYLLQRVKGLEQNDAKGKLLKALDYLACRHGKLRANGWTRIKFPFSQQALADLTGLSRETVSTVLKEIDELKIVRTPKQLMLEVHPEHLRQNL